MKEEVNAAAEFLSRIFLAHDNVAKEKVDEFNQHLSGVLLERFRDHWHESCPTKGQAYRCIRICPEEPLDPLLEKVCHDVGINVEDFNMPMELTLWVDPKEVVCKFGDLKCTYHIVAKKDLSSGALDNKTENLDIDDLVENARDLYLKKQTVVTHPVNSTEMHIQSPFSDSSSNGFSMALRINGTVHYSMSGSPPTGFDGSPRGKGKPPHSSHHKRGALHYYGKGTGGKGSFVANGSSGHVQGSHHSGSSGNGFPHHHNHHQQQQHHHHSHHHHGHHQHHSHHHSHGNSGYQNGYQDENGFVGFDQRAVSPSKMNGVGLPPMPGGGPPMTQSSPTPEQIQQQMQHPPPIPPPPIPNQLQQPFGHPPTDTSSLPPPPPPATQQPPSSSAITSTNSNISNSSNISNGGGKMSNSNNHNHGGSSSGKYQGNRGNGTRGGNGNNNRQGSPIKEMK